MIASVFSEISGAKSLGELALYFLGMVLFIGIICVAGAISERLSGCKKRLVGFLDGLANPYTDDYRASPLTDQPLDPPVETSEAGYE